MTQQFYDPYEQAVVDQTRKDIMEAGAKEDIAARASDIGRGGESAFGSRARLGATERQEALGRGLGEALGGIRSRGFQQAQQAAMGELGRQQQALTGLGGSLANVAGQRAAGMRGLGSTLAGYGQAGQQALSQAGQQALAQGKLKKAARKTRKVSKKLDSAKTALNMKRMGGFLEMPVFDLDRD